jgi:Na+-translocating ferredoxin:NAD+ oxidoreductase RnfC subunit
MKEGRRVPLAMLRKRLKVEEYEREAPYADLELAPRSVKLLLKQHAGVPASPVVREGQRVNAGDPVATIAAGQLGADVHASIAGTVRAVTVSFVAIEA